MRVWQAQTVPKNVAHHLKWDRADALKFEPKKAIENRRSTRLSLLPILDSIEMHSASWLCSVSLFLFEVSAPLIVNEVKTVANTEAKRVYKHMINEVNGLYFWLDGGAGVTVKGWMNGIGDSLQSWWCVTLISNWSERSSCFDGSRTSEVSNFRLSQEASSLRENPSVA